jgi:hypothetical protein
MNKLQALPVLIDNEILAPSDITSLVAMSEELTHAYTHRQIFRTETEARVSVLDDLHHPTKASKYWQAIREQTVMLEQLSQLSFEYRRNEVQIKRYIRDLEKAADELDIEDLNINLDECMFKRASMKTVAADRAREIRMWSMLKKELTDGSFDADNVDVHQLVSYTAQFAIRASIAEPGSLSGPELDNLTGLLQTSLKRCAELGVLDQLSAILPANITDQLQIES